MSHGSWTRDWARLGFSLDIGSFTVCSSLYGKMFFMFLCFNLQAQHGTFPKTETHCHGPYTPNTRETVAACGQDR